MRKIKLLFMDVDGTLTDGKIYMGDTGECFKAFNIKDGYGIHNILSLFDIVPVIITARESKIVEMRCRELNIENIFQGCKNKKSKMIEISKMYGITPRFDGILPLTAYIGDDIPDLECIKIAQYTGCPANSAKEIKNSVNYISSYDGGEGAVRDFIDWLTTN